MQDYIIATSSTADLPREYLEEHQIPFISYTYTVNGEIRQDDCREESRDANFKGMRAGDDLKTSMINAVQYEEYFRVLLDSGRDVIFLDMSEAFTDMYMCEHVFPHGFSNSAVAAGHLNEYGHQAIAAELIKAIEENS